MSCDELEVAQQVRDDLASVKVTVPEDSIALWDAVIEQIKAKRQEADELKTDIWESLDTIAKEGN